MKKLLMLGLYVCLVTGMTFGQEVLIQEMKYSFKDTTKKLEEKIKSKGLTVFAKIDHTKAAKQVGLTMNPAIVIIFGNPTVGTKLMQSDISWSYDLPLKIAIYEDNLGKVWVQARFLDKKKATPDIVQRIDAMNNLIKGLVQE